jgi:enoyl-CoA hydratase/long-chain 3-hydroxyacyl-CoA dehydrogenase
MIRHFLRPAPFGFRGLTTAASCATISLRGGGVAVVTLDVPGEKVNTLSKRLMDDFLPVMQRLETDAAIRSIVLISGKPDDFIAGADISMLAACATAAELSKLSADGQAMMDRVAALGARKPIVAAIHGTCLGGGLELALACTYRLASRAKKTKLGLPEVKLGLLPGAGGTTRLPRAVGVQQALTMMTAGGTLNAERALKAGLVHEVVEPAALEAVAVAAAGELAAGSLAAKRKPRTWAGFLLEGNPLGRALLFSQAAKLVAAASGGHYAAPVAILDVVRAGLERGAAAGAAAEAAAFGALGMTDTSRALRGIFFSEGLTRKLAAGWGGAGAAPPRAAGTLAVVGAGLMGAGIAQVSTGAGLRVVLKDRDAAAIARGEKQIAASLDAAVKRKRLTPWARNRQLADVTGVCDGDARGHVHLSRADAAVEAVFEDLAVKHRVIAALEDALPATALIATNTSAIPIAKIAAGAKRPERVVGIHYFSPVDKMPLAEVIPHAGTAPGVVAAAVALAQKQGKTVVVVRDVPGFYVNRCLGPYMAEGSALMAAGVDPGALDRALKAFGWPVGPVTLMDEVGVDVAFHTFETLKDALGNRMAGGNPEAMRAMVEGKMLGRKT